MGATTAFSWPRLWAMILKEFRQFLRDPVLIVLVLWLYTAEVYICADALTFELHGEAVAVLDLDRSHASRDLTDAIDRAEAFAVKHLPRDERAADSLLARGAVRMVLIVPLGYGRGILRAEAPQVQTLVDGTNSLVASTALGEVRRLVATRHAAALRAAPTARAAQYRPTVDNQVRIWYNPGPRYAYSVVTSMIASAAFMVGMILPATGMTPGPHAAGLTRDTSG